jgi:ribosomal protein L7/L12
VYLARKINRCSLGEAKEIVDSLRDKKVAQ